jgi:hypothetical protein
MPDILFFSNQMVNFCLKGGSPKNSDMLRGSISAGKGNLAVKDSLFHRPCFRASSASMAF